MNDDFIHQFEPPRPPRPEFTAALYQRITQPMKTTTQTRLLRAAALSFATVAVIAAVLFFSPSTRAFADSIIRQFGGYIFVQGTPQPNPDKGSVKKPEDTAGKPPAVSPQEVATLQAAKIQQATLEAGKNNDQNKQSAIEKDSAQPANDAAAASQLAGFTVLAPAYLPEGYAPRDQSESWTVSHENDGNMASINYHNQAADGFLVINEQMYHQQGAPNTVERPVVQDVTVRGQPGAWVPDPDGGKSVLVWDENGITYMIVSNKLPKDEVLKVAESLGQ